MLRAFTSRYDKPCFSCGCHVPAAAGFSVVENSEWRTYCRSSLCLPPSVYRTLTGRWLTKDGRAYMPYDEQAVEWARQFPGAKFVRPDNDQPYWLVSLKPEHREAVLDIARILKLEVAPELLDYTSPTTLAEVEVHAALERGKRAGAYPYQLAGIKFIAERSRCLIGDEPGLGKSAMSLLSIPSEHGTLVIVPASLKYNWVAECNRWRPDLKPHVLNGDSLPGVLWPSAGDVWIINPDALPDLPPPEAKRAGKVFIISDEAHLYKNTRTKRHKAVRAWNAAAAKVCIMTGTPMTNKPQDLWGTLSVAGLATQAFGKKAWFEDMFERGSRGELISPSAEVPKRLRKVMLRRTQDEVLKELPPSVYKQHIVSKIIPPTLAEKLDELYERVESALNMEKLPRIEDMSYVRSLLATFKITEMHELIEEYEEAELPLVLFSAHKEPVLSAARREGWASITGETKPEDRQAVVNDFQAGKLKGVALTVQAGGVGLTLTRAAHMLFVDLDWTPALNAQAEARIKRIGQKASHVHYTTMVVRHPVDERVLQLLEHKTRLFRESIDDVSDEYKVPTSAREAQRITGEYAPPEGTLVPYTETHEQRDARIAAYQAKKAEEEARERAKRQLLHVRNTMTEQSRQSQGVTGHEVAMRYRARASVAVWNENLKVHSATYQHSPAVDPERLRVGLAHMLSRCDGAHTKDDVGFNATDASIARHMVYLDIEGNQLHAEALARLLYKYKRQLGAVIPELYATGGQHGYGHHGHETHCA